MRFALLLENGCVFTIAARQRGKARAAKNRWNDARRRALAERSLAVPRRCIGLIRFKAPDKRP